MGSELEIMGANCTSTKESPERIKVLNDTSTEASSQGLSLAPYTSDETSATQDTTSTLESTAVKSSQIAEVTLGVPFTRLASRRASAPTLPHNRIFLAVRKKQQEDSEKRQRRSSVPTLGQNTSAIVILAESRARASKLRAERAQVSNPLLV